jgi:hypothetical protein
MRRILVIFIVLTLILLGVSYLLLQGGEIPGAIKQGESIISLTLTILQIVGIALAIVLTMLIILQYILYLRPRHFVFEGFSNIEALTDPKKSPLNLNALAQEKLLLQCTALYRALSNYPSNSQKADKILLDTTSLLMDKPFSAKNAKVKNEEDDITRFLTPNLLAQGELSVAKRELVLCAREIVRSLQEQNQVNVMSLMGEIAPAQISPLAKLINAVIPPYIIKSTAYLQYFRDDKSGSNRPGITLEIVNVRNQRRLALHTIWEEPNDTKSSIAASPGSSISSTTDQTIPQSQEQAHTESNSELKVDQYIDLLKPTLRWLAIMFLERRLLSHVPPINHILWWREHGRIAQVHYVLGVLYYVSAEQEHYKKHEEHNSFFWELAVEQFHKATIKEPDWCQPYLYLANIYSSQMHQSQGITAEERQKLLEQALELYDKALLCVKQDAPGQKPLYYRITIARAWTELLSDKSQEQKEAVKEKINVVSKQLKEDALNIASHKEGYASALYNLAICYITMMRQNMHVIDAWENARYYLAYALVCSWSLKDTIEKKMPPESGLYYVQALEDLMKNRLVEINNWPGEKLQVEVQKLASDAKSLMDRKLKQEKGALVE